MGTSTLDHHGPSRRRVAALRCLVTSLIVSMFIFGLVSGWFLHLGKVKREIKSEIEHETQHHKVNYADIPIPDDLLPADKSYHHARAVQLSNDDKLLKEFTETHDMYEDLYLTRKDNKGDRIKRIMFFHGELYGWLDKHNSNALDGPQFSTVTVTLLNRATLTQPPVTTTETVFTVPEPQTSEPPVGWSTSTQSSPPSPPPRKRAAQDGDGRSFLDGDGFRFLRGQSLRSSLSAPRTSASETEDSISAPINALPVATKSTLTTLTGAETTVTKSIQSTSAIGHSSAETASAVPTTTRTEDDLDYDTSDARQTLDNIIGSFGEFWYGLFHGHGDRDYAEVVKRALDRADRRPDYDTSDARQTFDDIIGSFGEFWYGLFHGRGDADYAEVVKRALDTAGRRPNALGREHSDASIDAREHSSATGPLEPADLQARCYSEEPGSRLSRGHDSNMTINDAVVVLQGAEAAAPDLALGAIELFGACAELYVPDSPIFVTNVDILRLPAQCYATAPGTLPAAGRDPDMTINDAVKVLQRADAKSAARDLTRGAGDVYGSCLFLYYAVFATTNPDAASPESLSWIYDVDADPVATGKAPLVPSKRSDHGPGDFGWYQWQGAPGPVVTNGAVFENEYHPEVEDAEDPAGPF